MKTTKEKIEVMQAFERGEDVQVKHGQGQGYEWEELPRVLDSEPIWAWSGNDYRVKPKEEKKQPTHEEIMTKWWKYESWWIKIAGYDPVKQLYRVTIGCSVEYFNKTSFADMQSADIPPEE
jgi:hypothetical protein